MKLLLPIGAVLIVLGLAGWARACYQTGDQVGMRQPSGQTETLATVQQDNQSRGRMLLAPLAGLALAAGLACVGIGIGNWKRPIPSDVRPANPWSDQPGEHGDPPRGQV